MTIRAIYENGVFRPTQAVDLPEKSEVVFEPRVVPTDKAPSPASIVDHVSFIIMRRLGITDAFTNDRHFKAAAFNTLF